MKYDLIHCAVLMSIELFVMLCEDPSKIESMQVEQSVFYRIRDSSILILSRSIFKN